MKKELREQVWLKYDKHCAYCGKVLAYKDMQVDHVIPQRMCRSDIKSIWNLMPSCRRCNHYKRWRNLEEFRASMLELHSRINNTYIVKVARDYDMIPMIKPFDGCFYFEKV